MDSGDYEFTTVTRKKKTRKTVKPGAAKEQQVMKISSAMSALNLDDGNDGLTVAQVEAKFKQDQELFKESSYPGYIGNVLKIHLQRHDTTSVRLVCYGIGSPSRSKSARLQLALLLYIYEQFGECNEQPRIYDPVFTEVDIAVLKVLGCKLFENDEAKRSVGHQETLFFMPHCCLPLYNNMLWKNWRKRDLARIAVLGNSFEYYDNHVPEKLDKEGLFVKRSLAFMEETKISCRFSPCEGAFNDLSLITFPKSLLSKVDERVWQNCEVPPVYGSSTELVEAED